MKTIDEVLKLQEKFDEEIKVKDSIYFLKEYCDKHVDCKECYIASRIYPYEACPCATLVNEVNVDDQ